jgi:hypothetical protein
MSKNAEKVGPLRIEFKKGIRPDGEITSFNLCQFEETIQLTPEQARSLLLVLANKLGIVTHG